ncbi:unnamed protein product [Arctogadus glacialis]
MWFLAHRVSKAIPESQENPDSLAHWDPVAPLDFLANLEMMVRLANQANLVSVGLLDLREHVASLEHLACPASRDTEAIQVLMELRESMALLALKASLDPLVRTAPPDLWVPGVCLAREVVQDPPDLLVLVEMMVCPVPLVPLAPSAPLELLASLDLLDLRHARSSASGLSPGGSARFS